MSHNRTRRLLFPSVVLLCCAAPFVWLAAGERSASSQAGADLSQLDALVEEAIAKDEIPGAVLLVWHDGQTLHRKAYGARAVLPAREPMTVDTVFDLASLTKILATATSVMKLAELGRIRLNDPVEHYIPEFQGGGKEQVTVRMLLVHHSGLRPIPNLPEQWSGRAAVMKSIYEDELIAPPGARFIYSDTGFIVLGELVRRVSGKPLDEFFTYHVARPLGLQSTRFLPPEDWRERIAPTEEIDLPAGAEPGSGRGRILRGVVHDPRARGMGGVAGHAGLFGTADDLAVFCKAILQAGAIESQLSAMPRSLLAPGTIKKMTAPQSPPWSRTLRGFGWDIDSVYSAPRGELFPLGSFGHTGFTGTSIWIDPASRTFVILLANSVHPRVRPAISPLRSKIATVVAAAVGAGPPANSAIERSLRAARLYSLEGTSAEPGATKTGIDVLVAQNFAPLAGKRVGLITNHTGVSQDGRSTSDLLMQAPAVKLVALFSPEHGIEGRAEGKIASRTDPKTGLPIHSLYGEMRRPTAAMLRGLDALVFDIQDAGVRFYTYITTMAYAMEAAARHGLEFYVLDRPNPLGGERIEGPLLDRDRLGFTGYFPLPVVHGMTVGELARMFNAENRIGARLHVVAMQGWRRSDTFELTGLRWVAPSPNLRSLDAALLYPGIEILQAGGVSVGRGTDTPFEVFGAPWIRAAELAAYLNRRYVPGVRFVPTEFTPTDGLHKGVLCQGIALVITDRTSLHSMLMGLEIAAALEKLYPAQFALDGILTLLGNAATLERLKRGDAPTRIVDDMADELAAFQERRSKYLLYR